MRTTARFKWVVLLLGLWFSGLAWSACSPYLGSVVFNEVQNPASGTTYLELRVLDPSVVAATNNFANWNIAVYKANSGTLTVSSSKVTNLKTVFTDPTKNTCGQSSPWIQIPDASLNSLINNANPNSDLNFVLYDTSFGTNQIIDVLRLGNANSFYTAQEPRMTVAQPLRPHMGLNTAEPGPEMETKTGFDHRMERAHGPVHKLPIAPIRYVEAMMRHSLLK